MFPTKSISSLNLPARAGIVRRRAGRTVITLREKMQWPHLKEAVTRTKIARLQVGEVTYPGAPFAARLRSNVLILAARARRAA